MRSCILAFTLLFFCFSILSCVLALLHNCIILCKHNCTKALLHKENIVCTLIFTFLFIYSLMLFFILAQRKAIIEQKQGFD